MINSVQIKNFQIHEDSIIHFGPNVNVIAGPSHNGKSAVFKAMRWALFNEPNGDGFIRHGSRGGANVTISVDEHTITRQRSSKLNQYILDNTVLKAMGTGVPDAVSTVANMDSSLNVQSQFDPFFMLQETSGAVAKKLNQIVGIEVIDMSLKKVNSLLMERKKKREYVKESLEKKEISLKEFDSVEAKLNDIAYIEELIGKREVLKDRSEDLADYLSKFNQYTDQIKEITFYDEKVIDKLEALCHSVQMLGRNAHHLIELSRKYDSLKRRMEKVKTYDEELINKIEGMIEEYNTVRDREFQLNKYLRDEQSVKSSLDEFGEIYGDEVFTSIEDNISDWCEKQKKQDKLKKAIKNYMSHEDKVARLKEEMDKLAAEEEILYEQNGGKCPICGGLKKECQD